MYDDNIPDEFDLDVRLTGSSSTLTSAVGTLYVPGGDETQEGCDVVETMDSCGFMGCGDIETQALPDCGGGGDTENPLLCGGGGGGGDTQELFGCGGGGGDTDNPLLCGGETMRCE
jgi:hypothetical protein